MTEYGTRLVVRHVAALGNKVVPFVNTDDYFTPNHCAEATEVALALVRSGDIDYHYLTPVMKIDDVVTVG